MRVRIVTDSTASIPAAICREMGITVVPVPIQFGADTFVDSVDPAEEFYARLIAGEHLPTTSTPSPGTFVEAFTQAAEGDMTVIAIHVMESKSTLINTARLAAGMLPEHRIHVVDSQTTTLGLGLLVVTAARAAVRGESADQILAMVSRLIPQVDTFAVIREMTQLRRSGRVSLGQALVAGVLSIKPILYIGHSVIEVADKVRSWPRAVDQMVEMAFAKVGDARVSLAVVHTNAEREGQELLERIRHRFNCAEVLVTEAGTALAAHAGAGALGIVTLQVD